MESTTKMASVGAMMRPMASTLCAAPVGALGGLDEDALGGGLGLEGGLHLFGCDGLAVGDGDEGGVESVGFGDIGPAFAEFASDTDDDFIAFGEEVGDGGVERAGAGRGEHQHVVRGAHDFLEVGETGSVDLDEVRRAMVHIARHHGVQRRRIEGSGAGSE